MARVSLVLLLSIVALLGSVLADFHDDDLFRALKRAPAASPQWEDLGWAWGKRSSGPLPQLRGYKQIKKNPDWHDLGWTWGRRK